MTIRLTKASDDNFEKYIETNNLENTLRDLYNKYRKKDLILSFEDINDPRIWWEKGADVHIIIYDDWIE
jgi:hypothetical protein